MPGPIRDRGAKKRKQSASLPDAAPIAKKPRAAAPPPPRQSLRSPHESLLAELAPRYDVLAASVISSTKIQKRVAGATTHLLAEADLPRVALLYARTGEVCKMITIMEQCKRILGEEGRQWFQYNQLFDLPEEPKKRDVVEETVLENDADETSDDDDFEVMHSRFEDALLPPPTTRTVKSLRVFLSLSPVPELKLKKDVTVQSSGERST